MFRFNWTWDAADRSVWEFFGYAIVWVFMKYQFMGRLGSICTWHCCCSESPMMERQAKLRYDVWCVPSDIITTTLSLLGKICKLLKQQDSFFFTIDERNVHICQSVISDGRQSVSIVNGIVGKNRHHRRHNSAQKRKKITAQNKSPSDIRNDSIIWQTLLQLSGLAVHRQTSSRDHVASIMQKK